MTEDPRLSRPDRVVGQRRGEEGGARVGVGGVVRPVGRRNRQADGVPLVDDIGDHADVHLGFYPIVTCSTAQPLYTRFPIIFSSCFLK